MTQTLSIKRKKFSFQKLLLLGAVLGVLGSVMGSLLYLALFNVVFFMPEFIQLKPISIRDLTDFITVTSGFYVGEFLITFFVSVIPATLAGLSNAWILASVESEGNLSPKRSMAIGALVGCFFGIIPISINVKLFELFSVHNSFGGEALMNDMIEIVICGMLTAAFVGSWHGKKLCRYLIAPL